MSSPTRTDSRGLREVADREIEEMRAQFEQSLAAHPTRYNAIDVERVRTSDWQCVRYLERSPTVDKAFEALSATLAWKQRTNVHTKKDADFPHEFYEINGLELLGRNADGIMVAWSTTKFTREFSDIRELIKPFIVHQMEMLDQMAGPDGLIMVDDAKHATLFTVDIELARFISDIVSKHYPGMARRALVLNLSYFLSPFFQLVLTFLDTETRAVTHIVSNSGLKTYLDDSFIPVAYGGTRRTRELHVPADAPSFQDMPDLGLTEEQKTFFKQLIKRLESPK